MKNSQLVYTTAGLLLAFTMQPAMAADPAMPLRGPAPFNSMDSDRDGFITQEEFRNAREERMKQREESRERYQYRNMDEAPRHADIDTDQDGRVSREEFQAHREKRMAERAREREERMQQREEQRQEMMERHQERRKEMEQQHPDRPGTGMGGE